MSDKYQALSAASIPVSYNEAGVAYVTWDHLRESTRRLGWEAEVASKVSERPRLDEGVYAWVLEEIVSDIQIRIERTL